MAYTQQTWVDNNPAYPVSAARLAHMEAGIAAAGSAGAAVGSPYVSNFGPTAVTIPVTEFGAKFDNVTDDTAAIQAALDASAAAFSGYSGFSGNDVPSIIVQLPPGRAQISAPLNMYPNMVLRGHGPMATFLSGKPGVNPIVQLKTGTEVSCEVRDLCIDIGDAASAGIVFSQTGGASALGDSRHVIENVVVLNGSLAIYLNACTEIRVSNCSLYYQTPLASHGALSVNSTDCMIDRVTVAQPAPGGSGAGIWAATSNTRFVNCKLFGGQVGTGVTNAFRLVGQRNQVIGLEVQDWRSSSFAVQDDQGNNIFEGLVIDSCEQTALNLGGPGQVRGFIAVNRGGGSFTMGSAISIAANAGADVEAKIVGVANIFDTAGNAKAAGNRYVFNQELGTQAIAFATPITPDPYVGGTVIVGTVTGIITVNAPTTTFGNAFHLGQQLSFWITQDGTGHAVTWNAAYHLTGAFANAASTTTKITFEFDGTVWREVYRAVTT